MKVVGITGSFGTGKTFVASIFKSLGAEALDADKIAHAVIGKGSRARKRIAALFGASILDKRRDIDRRKLAKKVFENRAYLRKLNRIVHPEVIAHIKSRIKKAAEADGVIVIDAPLLVEAGLAGMVDALVVVTCSRKKQIERCSRKFRIEKEDVLKRIRAQIPITKKIKMADFAIDNSGAKSQTRKQAIEIWRGLWR